MKKFLSTYWPAFIFGVCALKAMYKGDDPVLFVMLCFIWSYVTFIKTAEALGELAKEVDDLKKKLNDKD